MLLTQDTNSADFIIHSYEPGKIGVNDAVYTASIIISPTQLIENWPPQILSQLTQQDLMLILPLNPEVVLLGTGLTLQFPSQAILAGLINQGIGVEMMDTAAACRTYNVLTAEGRNVVAALLIN